MLSILFVLNIGAASSPPGMSFIPGGDFSIPFRKDSSTINLKVDPFYLDRHAVTPGAFIAFLKENPRYARSRVKRLFADSGYLQDWQGDLQPLPSEMNSPVTRISWHAAKEYCACQGKRLPTTAEWEFSARNLAKGIDTAVQRQAILDWYAKPNSANPPPVESGSSHVHGIRDLFGVVWEWTSDFNAYGFAGMNNRGVEDSGSFCGGGTTRAGKDVDYATYMRWAFRLSLHPDYTVGTLGFRCAKSLARKGD